MQPDDLTWVGLAGGQYGRARGGQIRHVAGIAEAGRDHRRLADPRLDHPVGVGGFQDRLLLMPGALAQHAVEAQADEQCNQCEDDDDGQT